MLSDVYNLLFSVFKNNSQLIAIFLFFPFSSIAISLFKRVCLYPERPSFRSSSCFSSLPEDADAYVLDSQGVLVPVYSFDRGD